ncbi:unnamed protein product [Lymnaea stagnalis]|uniref:Proton-coupled folate transporter n=1 Tax=Lymnaea stagnalis TaxID=6523 RepID=A0AAV2HIC7_LYMST
MARHIFIGCGRYRFDLAVITVEPVLFLYMFTNFLYYPTLQALIFNKVCLQSYDTHFCHSLQYNHTFKDEHKTENHEVTAETSFWILKTTIALTVSSFFVVIFFLGALGDKVGRKIPVILPCIGAFLAYLSGLLNAKYMSASLNYILFGPILNGLCGGYIACLMAVYSYIGHISTPASKITRVGIVESMVFLAGTIGVFVSGVMLDNEGYIFTFSTLCITMGITMVYAFVWLENVHSPGNIHERESCPSMMFKFLKESFHCVMKQRDGHAFSAIVLQILTLDILMLCTSGDMDIAMLYLKEVLNFSQTLFGYLKGLDNFLRGLILLTFLPLVRKYTKVKNLQLVMLGLLSYAAGFITIGAGRAKWVIFLGAVIGMFKGLPSAGLRATMSSLVAVDEQGRLFGVIAASESVISLLASVLFNELYPATYDIYPGLCYMLGAGLVITVLFLVIYVHFVLLRENASSVMYESIVDDSAVTRCNEDDPNVISS